MSKNKLIKAKVYEFYEPDNDNMRAPFTMNVYLGDINSVSEAKRKEDVIIGVGGDLLILKYPYETLLKEWKAYKEQRS